jgi:hypothetical protein
MIRVRCAHCEAVYDHERWFARVAVHPNVLQRVWGWLTGRDPNPPDPPPEKLVTSCPACFRRTTVRPPAPESAS